MAGKRIKFALKMKDGVEVRTLQELKESFDLNQVVSYYLNGKLEVWLLDRYYEDLAGQVQKLDESDPELKRRLSEIFGVEYQENVMKDLSYNIQKILEKVLESEFDVYISSFPGELVGIPTIGNPNDKSYHSELSIRKEAEYQLRRYYDVVKNHLNKHAEGNYAIQVSDQLFRKLERTIIMITTMLNDLDENVKLKNKNALCFINKELELERLHDKIREIAGDELDNYFFQLGDFFVDANDITIQCFQDFDHSSPIWEEYRKNLSISVDGEMVTVSSGDFDVNRLDSIKREDYYTYDAQRASWPLQHKLDECCKSYPSIMVERYKKDIILPLYNLFSRIDEINTKVDNSYEDPKSTLGFGIMKFFFRGDK